MGWGWVLGWVLVLGCGSPRQTQAYLTLQYLLLITYLFYLIILILFIIPNTLFPQSNPYFTSTKNTDRTDTERQNPNTKKTIKLKSYWSIISTALALIPMVRAAGARAAGGGVAGAGGVSFSLRLHLRLLL